MNYFMESGFGHFDAPAPASDMRWLETLSDRSRVLIRPLEPADGAARSAFEAASSRMAAPLYLVGQIPNLPKCFSKLWSDGEAPVVFGAFVYDGAEERLVGLGEFCTFERGLRCRCMVLVDAEWQDKGLGPALMRPLMALGESRGMRQMYARSRSGNGAMNDLAHRLGFRTRLDVDDPAWLIHELGMAVASGC